MLRTFSLAKAYLGGGWAIHPLTGSLLKTSLESVNRFSSSKVPQKIDIALKQVNQPYLLKAPLSIHPVSNFVNLNLSSKEIYLKNKFENLKLSKSLNFYLALLYAGIPSICFENSRQAFATLNSFPFELTRDSCLEKCLTVAKCSASFRDKGVLFIGAHLPLQAMHAWIIEDDYQPDEADRQWINYLPLMAITRS